MRNLQLEFACSYDHLSKCMICNMVLLGWSLRFTCAKTGISMCKFNVRGHVKEQSTIYWICVLKVVTI